MDVIESTTVHAAYPILFAKHTALNNLISAEHLCVPYPRLTNSLRFRLKSRGTLAEAAGSVMEMRGFERSSSPSTEERRLFDSGCMILPLGLFDGEPDYGLWAEVGSLNG